MKNKKKFHILNIRRDKSLSRFVVDLKKQLEKKEEQEKNEFRFSREKFMDSLFDKDYERSKKLLNNLLEESLDKTEAQTKYIYNYYLQIKNKISNYFAQLYTKHEARLERLSQISIFAFLIMIGQLFGRFWYFLKSIAYYFGYLLIILVRFFYLVFGMIFFGRIIYIPTFLALPEPPQKPRSKKRILYNVKKIITSSQIAKSKKPKIKIRQRIQFLLFRQKSKLIFFLIWPFQVFKNFFKSLQKDLYFLKKDLIALTQTNPHQIIRDYRKRALLRRQRRIQDQLKNLSQNSQAKHIQKRKFSWQNFFKLKKFRIKKTKAPEPVLNKREVRSRRAGLKSARVDTSALHFGFAKCKLSVLKKIKLFLQKNLLRTKSKNKFKDFFLHFKLGPGRSVLFFAFLLLILILPLKFFDFYQALNIRELKNQVLGAGGRAIADLRRASESIQELDFNKASLNFSQAGSNFLDINNQLAEINNSLLALARLVPNEKIRFASEGKHLARAGEAVSNLGENLSLAFASLINKEQLDYNFANGKISFVDDYRKHNTLDVINNFIFYIGQALVDAARVNASLFEISVRSVPRDYRDEFQLLCEKSRIFENGLREFHNLANLAKIFLGEEKDKRYLVVFQNNTEMRASGGFLGSFALVDFSQGSIKNIEVPQGGSYDLKSGLEELVHTPDPMLLIGSRWYFHDANWWPDWPTTARKLMWFYEKSGGPSVDGVISFTPTVFENFLKIFGPLDLQDKYSITLNSNNFWQAVQSVVESPEARQTRKPKKIIGDILAKLINEAPKRINPEMLTKLLVLGEESLSEKHILFYFRDQVLQDEVLKYGWDGKISETSRDYLAVINTNIMGEKSDRKMQEIINHQAEIQANGDIINTLEIKRIHTGHVGEFLSGVRNVNWMRIYVPQGSELLEASGFRAPDEKYFKKANPDFKIDPLIAKTEALAKVDMESGSKIYNEGDKTVFANWSMVNPGKTATIYVKYKLPFNVLKDRLSSKKSWRSLLGFGQNQKYIYSLLVQKQSGSIGSKINSQVILDNNFYVLGRRPENIKVNYQGWDINSVLDTDKYWGIVFEERE